MDSRVEEALGAAVGDRREDRQSSAPPICCAVLIRPDASPASCGLVPVTAAIVTDTKANPNPAAASSDGPRTSATYEPPGAGTRENQTRPPATSSSPAISVGRTRSA